VQRLAISTGLTSLGKWGFAVTLSVYAFHHGGARTVGLVALAQALPAMALAPFLALVGDTLPRRDVLLVANLLRGLVLVAVAGTMNAGGAPLIVFALAVGYSIVSATNQPARAALLTALATSPRRLSAGNALLGFADTLGFVAGSGVGGVLLAATSFQSVVVGCGAAYLLAVVVIAGIPRDGKRRPVPARIRAAHMVAATRAVRRDGGLRAAFVLIGGVAITAGLTSVLVVVVAIDLLDLGPAGVGWLNTAFGVGGLLAGPVMLVLLRGAMPRLGAPAGALLVGLPLAALAAAVHTGVAVVAWTGLGLGSLLVRNTGLTLAQRLASDRMLAPVLGLLEMVIVGGTGIGAAIAPALLAVAGASGALAVTAALLPVVTAAVWASVRSHEIDARVTAADFRLLRADPIFAPLSIATIEALAGQLDKRHAAAGETLVTQGEPGAVYFLVARGVVEVLVDGVPRRQLGPGGSFGEIALLHDVPRTATVRAIEPTELRILGRERFLLAVTGEPESQAAANAVADALLASVPAPGYRTV
jgi:hypothetical protein